MPDDHRPPEEIWLDDERLGDHFDRVREQMKAGSGGGGDQDWQDIPEQNELTEGIKRR